MSTAQQRLPNYTPVCLIPMSMFCKKKLLYTFYAVVSFVLNSKLRKLTIVNCKEASQYELHTHTTRMLPIEMIFQCVL